ncbi:MAG: hypothetical protein L0332_30995 [Chloroflexi bacterium]|nr:hypothetical protein [Chloroflexota bacterium]MCI0731128.1 hypothetical protein [Chloroflexota bacterium]
MKTQDIYEFVDEVLRKRSWPWPEDITYQVVQAIENDPSWRRRYQQLERKHGRQSLNSNIGYYTRQITGLANSGKRRKAPAGSLIKSYAILVG